MNSSNSQAARTLAESDLLKALGELANLRDEREAFERFCKRWPELAYVSDNAPELHPIEVTELPTKFWLIYERREYLRDVWEGDTAHLKKFLLPTEPPEDLPGRGAYIIDRNSTAMQVGFEWETQIDLDWRRSQIVYEPKTEFQRAIYTLFRKSALAKVCANPDCPARYFVARKTTQRYCSDKCAEVFQRASKRKWWAERGDAWRRDRKKPSRKRRGKG